MFTDLNLSDMETGYKVFRREIVQALTLEENRFGIEPELVATGLSPVVAKALAAALGVFLNFAGRRFVVFRERGRGPWATQVRSRDAD